MSVGSWDPAGGSLDFPVPGAYPKQLGDTLFKAIGLLYLAHTPEKSTAKYLIGKLPGES